MLKSIYLRLLKNKQTRQIARLLRARVQRIAGYSDPFYDLAKICRVSNADSFIDIGCHTGETLLRFLESGVRCNVTAFDPIGSNIDGARRLLANKARVSFVGAALSDTDGTASFFVNRNEQTSSLLDNDKGNAESFSDDSRHVGKIEVKTCMLDTWMSSQSPPYNNIVIKCDTQGAEGKVVKGGLKTLKQSVNAFYCEVMLGNMYSGQASFEELRNMLENECGLVLKNIYPCLHDPSGRAVQFDALWVKPAFLKVC